MIEQFGEFLLALKRKINGEQHEEALEEINEAFKALLGMDSDFITHAPDDYLVLMTSLNSGGDASKTLMLADLLNMQADALEMRGDYEQSDALSLKALNVLARVALQLTHAPMADHLERIEMFVDKLQNAVMPLRTKDALFQVYERVGQFAKAEDVLFDMLDAASEDEDEAIAEGGAAFYRRLLQHNDHELETGGLPRAEVEEGLRELTE
jgi:tetratricopeptide (TPR) repeat protein